MGKSVLTDVPLLCLTPGKSRWGCATQVSSFLPFNWNMPEMREEWKLPRRIWFTWKLQEIRNLKAWEEIQLSGPFIIPSNVFKKKTSKPQKAKKPKKNFLVRSLMGDGCLKWSLSVLISFSKSFDYWCCWPPMIIRAGLAQLNKNYCCKWIRVFFILGESKYDVLLHCNVFCVIFISDSQISLLDACFLYWKGQRNEINTLCKQWKCL